MYLNFLFFYPSKKTKQIKKKIQEENSGTFQRKIIYLKKHFINLIIINVGAN